MKEWKIRAISEKDLGTYAKKLQSTLNRMEKDGFEFTIEGPGAQQVVEINGEIRFFTLVTGSRTKPAVTATPVIEVAEEQQQ